MIHFQYLANNRAGLFRTVLHFSGTLYLLTLGKHHRRLRRLLNILKEPGDLNKLSNICFNNPSIVQWRIGAVLPLLSSRVFFYLAHVLHSLLLLLLLIVNYIVPFSFCLFSFSFFFIFYSGISLSVC